MMKTTKLISIIVIVILLALASAGTIVFTSNHDTNSAISSHQSQAGALQPNAASDTVYITRTGACYHRGTCSSLSRSKIKTTRGQAIFEAHILGIPSCEIAEKRGVSAAAVSKCLHVALDKANNNLGTGIVTTVYEMLGG